MQDHDPLPRLMPNEKYFALLARDHRAPFIADIYAVVRLRKRAVAHTILDNLLDAEEAAPYEPHKAQEHAWSARARAQEMRDWFLKNRAHPGLEELAPGVIATAGGTLIVEDDPSAVYEPVDNADAGPLGEAVRLEAIRKLRPPLEPDEAA